MRWTWSGLASLGFSIFHCLNIPQNSPNLEYMSHLPKNFIIYCRPRFPPLGGVIIKESAFGLITLIYFIAHSKTLYPCVFFPQIYKMSKTYFFELLQVISPISTKICTQHLWTLLTINNFSYSIHNTQVIKQQLPIHFAQKTKCCIAPLWSVWMTWNSSEYFPMSLFRLCAKCWQMTTRWRYLNWIILHLHIGWSD